MKQIELLDKRKPREKHFLQNDGTIKAIIYDKDIHCLKNGKYEEIDNSLIEENGYYTNKNNLYKVFFKENDDDDALVKYEYLNHHISLKFANGKTNLNKIERENKNSIGKIKYVDFADNIDLEYKILSTKLKESIIIKNKINIPNVISFNIDTDLNLILNSDSTISALENDKIIFTIDAPYMMDSKGEINTNIHYKLYGNSNNYILDLILDTVWLNDDNTIYPVIIDPTITGEQSDSNVVDTYIYNGDSSATNGVKDILKVGVENVDGSDIINRALLRFTLPEIGTGSQIVNATLNLVGYLAVLAYSELLEIHRITVDWDENTAKWDSLNDKFDEKIEGLFYSKKSYQNADNTITAEICEADVTNLVRKWYTDVDNFGILIKQSIEEYKSGKYSSFYSKDNTLSGDNPKPVLTVVYRNQNGLEDYMKYIPQSFTIGTTFVNTFNGNLVGDFSLMQTTGENLPVSLNLIYNTNDVILNSDIGYGVGYRFNLHQTIRSVLIDSVNYLEYIDEDGTIHYFIDKKYVIDENGNTITISEDNTFYDEDGLDLKIVEENQKYLLIDKDGNIMEFIKSDNVALLTLIKNKKNEVINISYDQNNRISSVTDGNMDVIQITYNDIMTVYCGDEITTVYYNDNNQISKIVKTIGETNFEYNNNKVISKIIDPNGTKIQYSYYEKVPYRIYMIQELGIENGIGMSIEFKYNFSATTIIDNKGRATTYTFNNYGNVVSTSNLMSATYVKDAYGKSENYGTEYQYKNKLISLGIPIKNVNNYLDGSSFEGSYILFSAELGIDMQISLDCSETGASSLKVVNTNTEYNKSIWKDISVPKNSFYTFSAYTKNQDKLLLKLSYFDSNNNEVEKITNINANTKFERNDVTIFYPSDASSDLKVTIVFCGNGINYVDDVQLEEGEICNYYNIIDCPTFYDGTDYFWNLGMGAISDYEGPLDSSEIFDTVLINDNCYAFRVRMKPYLITNIFRGLETSGSKGDFYTFCFWYKNEGIVGIENESYNKVTLEFEYSTIGLKQIELPLNSGCEQWQYFSYTFEAEDDYTYLRLSLDQKLNANDFYFTNVGFYKNINCNLFEYDKNGNIKSVENINQNKTTYNYDLNDKLTKYTTSNGYNVYTEYDNQNINKKIGSYVDSGLSNRVKYNNNGKPIANITRAHYKELYDGLYSIRQKGTDKYLKYILGRLELCDESSYNDFWIKSTDYSDGYENVTLQHAVSKKCICNENGNLILKNIDECSTFFEFIKNENGSYLIKVLNSNLYLMVYENYLVFSTLIENDNRFEFYFEFVNTNHIFFENDIEYGVNEKYMTKTTDSLLNSLYYDVDNDSGVVNSISDNNNRSSAYTYDEKKRINSVSLGDKIVNYSYNSNNLISSVVQDNRRYDFTYDEFLNFKSLKINDTYTLINNNFELNNGKLLSSCYGNNDSIFYDYDDFDRLVKITKDSVVYTFSYNNFGDLTKICYGNNEIKFHYDSNKRVIKCFINDIIINYEYNENNFISSKLYLFDSFGSTINYSYLDDNSLSKIEVDNNEIEYVYDFGRLSQTKLNQYYNISYNYLTNGKRSSFIKNEISYNDDKYYYKYNKLGNITHIYHNEVLENRYYYDYYSELIREDNFKNNTTIRYKYDLYGNMISRKIYELNSYNLLESHSFGYNDNSWKDKLTLYDGLSISYDEIGNPLSFGNNIALTWKNGRELSSYTTSTLNVEYEYNENGKRVGKTVNNKKTSYFLEDDKLIYEETDNVGIFYIRSNKGELVGFKYNNNVYFYIKNLQGDIIGILDCYNEVVAKYEYDAYGNILSILDSDNNDVSSSVNHVANINAFRYRSYYYDSETQLYYLGDRYYNPKLCRFLNPDGMIGSDQKIISLNLYVYCGNNPVNHIDINGNFPWACAFLLVAVVTAYTSIQMLGTAVLGDGKKLKYSEDSMLSKKLKTSKIMENEFKQNVKDYSSNNTNAPKLYTSENKDLNFKNTRKENISDFDLAYSVGRFTYNMVIEKETKTTGFLFWKKEKTRYVGYVKVYDEYDFDYQPEDGSLPIILNNYGVKLEEYGIIKPYLWEATYTCSTKWE